MSNQGENEATGKHWIPLSMEAWAAASLRPACAAASESVVMHGAPMQSDRYLTTRARDAVTADDAPLSKVVAETHDAVPQRQLKLASD